MVRRVALVGLLLMLLAGCRIGGPGPEEVAVQVVQALDQQDVATLNVLLDKAMPYKDITLLTELQTWQDRVKHNPDWEDALGPLVNTEAQPAREAGASTLVTVLLHHQDGEAKANLTLHKTPEGWRVLAWDIKNLSKHKVR